LEKHLLRWLVILSWLVCRLSKPSQTTGSRLHAHTLQQMDETRYQKVYQDGAATGCMPGKAVSLFPPLV